MIWLFMLVCINASNCPKEAIYSSEPTFSEQACREKAPKVATYMHYAQGGDWSWKCFQSNYEPKEIK